MLQNVYSLLVYAEKQGIEKKKDRKQYARRNLKWLIIQQWTAFQIGALKKCLRLTLKAKKVFS